MLPNEHMVTLGMFHIDALPDQHPAGSVIISHHSDLQNGNASARDGMDWEEGHDSSHLSIRYLVIDTNVLIDHLTTVKRIHDAVLDLRLDLRLLIPCVVINELDRLKNAPPSTTGDQRSAQDGTDIRNAARQATAWLLSMHRQGKELPGTAAVRIQRWADSLDRSLRKADDRILDCCLYFQDRCGGITLWTQDRNLALLAEANDVNAPELPRPTVVSALLAAGIGMTADVEAHLLEHPALHDAAIGDRKAEMQDTDAGGMDLDEDLAPLPEEDDPFDLQQEMPTSPSPTPSRSTKDGSLLAVYLSTLPQHNDNDDMPDNSSPTFSGTTTPSSPTNLTDPACSTFPARLTTALRPLQDRLLALPLQASPGSSKSTSASTWLVDSGTTSTIASIIDKLATIESTLSMSAQQSRPSDDQVHLLRAIAAFRTLQRYADYDVYSRARRPRVGEVAEALTCLASLLTSLGLADEILGEQLMLFAGEVKGF